MFTSEDIDPDTGIQGRCREFTPEEARLLGLPAVCPDCRECYGITDPPAEEDLTSWAETEDEFYCMKCDHRARPLTRDDEFTMLTFAETEDPPP